MIRWCTWRACDCSTLFISTLLNGFFFQVLPSNLLHEFFCQKIKRVSRLLSFFINKQLIFPKLAFMRIWVSCSVSLMLNCNFNWRHMFFFPKGDLVNCEVEHASRKVNMKRGPCGLSSPTFSRFLSRFVFLPLSLHTLEVGTDGGSSQPFPPDITQPLHTHSYTHNGVPQLTAA